jgi:GNAT superfamily N-acetyltransferase
MDIAIRTLAPHDAAALCTAIAADLPEYFGIPTANAMYAKATSHCYNLAAFAGNSPVGLISIAHPYSESCQIQWMGILRDFQGRGIGTRLIVSAEAYALEKGARFLTLETLSPTEEDHNDAKNYAFYKKCGFMPLCDTKPEGYLFAMCRLAKSISHPLSQLVALERDARSYGFDWPNREMVIDQAISECEEIRAAIADGE